MKGIPCLWIDRVNIKMFTLLNTVYGFSVISNKFSVTFSTDTEKKFQNSYGFTNAPTMQFRKQQLERDMKQQTGSK